MNIDRFNLTTVVEQVGKEKNISKEILISALEAAMLSAARKKIGSNADLEAKYNGDTGEVEVFEFKEIVDKVLNPSTQIDFSKAKILDPELKLEDIGEDLGIKLNSSNFGRIAAQNAKQIIVQRVREAERSVIFSEYKDRQNELVTGTVRRLERGNIIIDLGRAEAVIPVREQMLKENIRVGDRVVAYVLDVLEVSRGPQIILSRTNPNLVVKLFEQEVPEIEDETISIESVSREPGLRSKISVRSKDSDVDPVGACVGIKGSRVQSVVQELRGEKIDIVPFDEDAAAFVCNALAPAEIARVLINEGEHKMQIVVPDEQISLAIGRRGQNVRLAAELTGWKIDINSETKVSQERDITFAAFAGIKSLNELQIQTLYNHGLRKISDLNALSMDFLISLPGFEKNKIQEILDGAKKKQSQEKQDKIDFKKEARCEAKILLLTDQICDEINVDSKLLIENISIITEEEKDNLIKANYKTIADVYLDEDNRSLVVEAKLSNKKADELMKLASKLLISEQKNVTSI